MASSEDYRRLLPAGACLWLAAGCGGVVERDPGGVDAVRAVTPLSVPRAVHTATLLRDGRILIAGGFDGQEEEAPHATAELFDPVREGFSPAARMARPRLDHTATRLDDGNVLIAGGFAGTALAGAELYDPAADRFTETGHLANARNGHKAVRLRDGRVLIVGGEDAGGALASAEIYDPPSGRFTPTGSMAAPRVSHTATLLADGRVLITGGHQGRQSAIQVYDSAEIFQPATGGFRPTGSMGRIRHKHDAAPLADGRVLIVGGADARDDGGAYDSVEVYDPAAGTFAAGGRMAWVRYKHQGTSLPLPSGEVLLAGGAAEAEVYDPVTRAFTRVPGDFGDSLLFATATRLLDDRVLVTGGYGRQSRVRASAWIVTP